MIPAIVVQAAAVAQRDSHGVVAYRIHQTSVAAGGPMHLSTDVVLAVVTDGQKIVRVKVLRFVKDGSPQDAMQKNGLAHDLLAGQSSGGFAVPFDRRHFDEYAYTANGRTVQFRSLVRDANHGDGTFVVDGTGHVTRMRYVPDVLPKYATRGVVTVTRAEVMPGFWASARTDQEYDGKYLFIRGHDSTVTTNTSYRRYVGVAQAERALEGGTSR